MSLLHSLLHSGDSPSLFLAPPTRTSLVQYLPSVWRQQLSLIVFLYLLPVLETHLFRVTVNSDGSYSTILWSLHQRGYPFCTGTSPNPNYTLSISSKRTTRTTCIIRTCPSCVDIDDRLLFWCLLAEVILQKMFLILFADLSFKFVKGKNILILGETGELMFLCSLCTLQPFTSMYNSL